MSNLSLLANNAEEVQLITVRIHNQLLGIPIFDVKEILQNQNITPIPLVSKEIAGSLNLRGRIVTVLDIRHRLQLPEKGSSSPSVFVVVENKGELYSFLADSIGDVITIPLNSVENTPSNLSVNWKGIATGVHKLENELLVILNLHELLSFEEINN